MQHHRQAKHHQHREASENGTRVGARSRHLSLTPGPLSVDTLLTGPLAPRLGMIPAWPG